MSTHGDKLRALYGDDYFSRIGRKGAKAVNDSMTPEQRQERARKAVTKRWQLWYAENPQSPKGYIGPGGCVLAYGPEPDQWQVIGRCHAIKGWLTPDEVQQVRDALWLAKHKAEQIRDGQCNAKARAGAIIHVAAPALALLERSLTTEAP